MTVLCVCVCVCVFFPKEIENHTYSFMRVFFSVEAGKLKGYSTDSSLFQKYLLLTGIYNRNRLLKTQSENSNPNCYYIHLKFMHIRF